MGFTKQGSELYAVLKQPFIISDAQADLKDIKSFLTFNGFENNRRNDYIHKELGLILEDMHDENVIVNPNKTILHQQTGFGFIKTSLSFNNSFFPIHIW